MYAKINNVTYYNMTDREKYVYLMKRHWKELSHYRDCMELVWDKINNILYKQT